MSVKPSAIAKVQAAKRAKLKGTVNKSLNLMDTLKAMDRESARADKLEKRVAQLEAKVNWLISRKQ